MPKKYLLPDTIFKKCSLELTFLNVMNLISAPKRFVLKKFYCKKISRELSLLDNKYLNKRKTELYY